MTKTKHSLLSFALAVTAPAFIFAAGPANAGIGDSYFCKTDNVVQLSQNGMQQMPQQIFGFQWKQNSLVFDDFPLISDFSPEVEIVYQDDDFVSSRTMWGDINFSDSSGVMVAYVGRQDMGFLHFARCSRR